MRPLLVPTLLLAALAAPALGFLQPATPLRCVRVRVLDGWMSGLMGTWFVCLD